MVSPLCGFRPSRAGRAAKLKVPRPETRTASPAASELRMAATTAFTAWPASLVFSFVASATFSTNSDWFISDLQLHCYETPPLKAKRCKVCARVCSARSPARGSEIGSLSCRINIVILVPTGPPFANVSILRQTQGNPIENVRIQEGCCPNRISKSKQRAQRRRSVREWPLSRHKIGCQLCRTGILLHRPWVRLCLPHKANRRRSLGTLFPREYAS